ncbi:hypothetical protein SESBI_00697 [Sesbania bispinosa]|nr:hypothetical protein SESBI_00697 [Sesbania bispinosa]
MKNHSSVTLDPDGHISEFQGLNELTGMAYSVEESPHKPCRHPRIPPVMPLAHSYPPNHIDHVWKRRRYFVRSSTMARLGLVTGASCTSHEQRSTGESKC